MTVQMGTATGRLQWAFDFALRDLDALTPGGWLTLREELAAFFGFGVVSSPLADAWFSALPTPLPQHATQTEFRALQRETLRILELAAKPTGGQSTRKAFDRFPLTSVEITAAPFIGAGTTTLTLTGPVQQLFV